MRRRLLRLMRSDRELSIAEARADLVRAGLLSPAAQSQTAGEPYDWADDDDWREGA